MDPRRRLLLFFLAATLSSGQLVGQKLSSSEKELGEKAEASFKAADYTAAAASYSQLLSLYPSNVRFNYYYGICLLRSGKEKEKAAEYLEVASAGSKISDDVFFYLGQAYLYAGKYDGALNAYATFRTKAGASNAEKYGLAHYEQCAATAKELSKHTRDVGLINSQQVILYGFYTIYDYSHVDGKILSTPSQYLSSKDKEKMNDPVMCLSGDNRTIFYASYGKNSRSGKDIYRVTKQSDGTWGKPELLDAVINSNENEDFPFWDQRTHTLYFSSKGHNGIGGYDIYKSVWDESAGRWSQPENMGLPVNTPDDDVLFVPGASGNSATYATNVHTEKARIEVRQVRIATGETVPSMQTVKGIFTSTDQVFRKDARLTVRNTDGSVAGTVTTNDRTGEYELKLKAGEDYTLVVEAGGFVAHSESFRLPESSAGTLRQEIVVSRANDRESMKLNNYFEQEASAQTVAMAVQSPEQVTLSAEQPAAVAETNTVQEEQTSAPAATAVRGEESSGQAPARVAAALETRDRSQPVGAGNDQHEALAHEAGTATASSVQQAAEHRAAEVNGPVDPSQNQQDVTALTPVSSNVQEMPAANRTVADGQYLKEQMDTTHEPLPSFGTYAQAGPEAVQKEATTRRQAATLDSVAASQLTQARNLILEGKKENIGLAQAIYRESLQNKKLADSATADADRQHEALAAWQDNPVSATSQGTEQVNAEPAMPGTVAGQSAAMSGTTNIQETTSAAAEPGNDAQGISRQVTAMPVSQAENTGAVETEQPVGPSAAGTASVSNAQEQPVTAMADSPAAVSPGQIESTASNEVPVNEQGAQSAKTFTELDETVSASGNTVSVPPANEVSGQQAGETAVVAGRMAASPVQEPSDMQNQENNPADSQVASATHATVQPVAGDSASEAAIASAVEQLDPGAREPVQQYRSLMKESTQLDEEAGQIVKQVSAMKPSKERDEAVRKANTLYHTSIVKWQQAQQQLQQANAADTALQSKLPAEAFDFSTGGNAPAAAASAGREEKEWDTTSQAYFTYRQVQATLDKKQQETILNFAGALSSGQQAEQKYQEEADLRKQAAAESDPKRKSDLFSRAFRLKLEADSLDMQSVRQMDAARHARNEARVLTRNTEESKAGLEHPVLAAKAKNGNGEGFYIPVGNTPNPATAPANGTTSQTSNELVNVQDTESPATRENRDEQAVPAANSTTGTQQMMAQDNGAAAGEATAATADPDAAHFAYEKESVQSNTTTLPMNPVLPEGLIFKVQVGAFRKPVPVSSFRGINPVTGETSRVGWIRYCVGMFRAVESASAVRDEMRKGGFRDAFVVAYLNGKRITMNEAWAWLGNLQPEGKQEYAAMQGQEQKLLEEMHIPVSASLRPVAMEEVPTPAAQQPAVGAIAYAVQVGVYRTSKTPKAIQSMTPLYTQQINDRAYRFLRGNFSAYDEAVNARSAAVRAGVKDAFIVVYKDGKRLSSTEATAYCTAEQPAVTEPAGNAMSSTAVTTPDTNESNQPVSGPSDNAAASVNKIEYKVRLCSYSETVPVDMVSLLVGLSDAGVSRVEEGGKQVFYAGSFPDYNQARVLRDTAVTRGMINASVVAFSNGKKFAAPQAMEEMK